MVQVQVLVDSVSFRQAGRYTTSLVGCCVLYVEVPSRLEIPFTLHVVWMPSTIPLKMRDIRALLYSLLSEIGHVKF